jgi:malonyl-CoA decarboxylase
LVRSIHDIIDVGKRDRAPVRSPDTAIFYSINNTQDGLAGLGLGKVLVFRVTEALRARHPTLRTFATLSPIPGFRRRYLLPILDGDDTGFSLSRDAAVGRFPTKSRDALRGRHRELGGADGDFSSVLRSILSRSGWHSDPVFIRHLQKPLREIALIYLAGERDRRGRPLNPVANFHLGNGATLAERNVNFGANTSPRGIDESCGLMVNYLYSRTTFQQLGSTVRSLLPWSRRGL